VIWLSFQECTGCTESLTRSDAASIEDLIFNTLSLDYPHILQAASGTGAEDACQSAMKENWGKYLLVVDMSIPTGNPGYSIFRSSPATPDLVVHNRISGMSAVSIKPCPYPPVTYRAR
jgi:hydrogenase small subunit